jgi:hypothetical protein
MRLQLEVDQTGDLNPNQFTPKVVLVDEEGNPLTLGDGTPVEVTIDDVEGLTAALAGKAASSHTHTIANVTSLQDALDGKQAAGSYAAASHTHTAAQVNVAADATNGISAGTLQAVLSALAARVVALEEAAA